MQSLHILSDKYVGTSFKHTFSNYRFSLNVYLGPRQTYGNETRTKTVSENRKISTKEQKNKLLTISAVFNLKLSKIFSQYQYQYHVT